MNLDENARLMCSAMDAALPGDIMITTGKGELVFVKDADGSWLYHDTTRPFMVTGHPANVISDVLSMCLWVIM